MSKKINFEYEGEKYVLEFTRRSIETMERQGFIASEITEKPMTTLPNLFAGAFIAHHKGTKRKLIDEIYRKLINKDELLQTLAEMYNEPIEALMGEPDEDEGNITWGASC